MAIFMEFSDPVKTRYKTSICSKASLVLIFINFLVFAFPLFIAYRTQGFWLKSDYYLEQPEVSFTYDYLILLETNKVESPIICTTLSSLVKATESFNNCPIIKAKETDINHDGKIDEFYFELEANINDSDNVYSATMLLFFNYKLYSYSWLEMQTMGMIESSTNLGGSRLQVAGDLRLKQRQPLKSMGRDLRFNSSLVNANETYQFNLYKTLLDYSRRNITTRVDNVYSVWTRLRSPEKPFRLSIELTYPEEVIIYRPGTWHVIKYAWFQYLSILFIFILIGRKTKRFILENKLVHNVKVTPWKKIN